MTPQDPISRLFARCDELALNSGAQPDSVTAAVQPGFDNAGETQTHANRVLSFSLTRPGAAPRNAPGRLSLSETAGLLALFLFFGFGLGVML